MLNKNLFFLLFVLVLSACSTSDNLQAAGEQRIQIRVWRDNTPDFLQSAATSTGALMVDVSKENAIEFDMQVVDDQVYVIYKTDREAYTAIRPAAGWATSGPNMPPVELNIGGVIPANMVRYTRVRTTNTEIFTAFDTGGREINRFLRNVSSEGFWLRFFRGRAIGSIRVGNITWEAPLILNQTQFMFSQPKIVPLPSNRATASIVLGNNDVAIIQGDGSGEIRFLYNPLPIGISNPSTINQFNTWQQNGLTFLAMVVDGNRIVTGSFSAADVWVRRSIFQQPANITEFQVLGNRQGSSAVWMLSAQKRLIVASYQLSSSSRSPWVEIGRINSVKAPKLTVTTSTAIGGEIVENIYIGTVNELRNFFQLFRIRGFNAELVGPIITEWNEIYDIVANDVGQVLYVRSNFNQELLFAGLNSLQRYDQLQRNNPPPVIIHSRTKIDSAFLNESNAIMGFRVSNGAFYLLSGVR